MSTRSILIIVGTDNHGLINHQTRIYKHCDGYPTHTLALFVDAIKQAKKQIKEYIAQFEKEPKNAPKMNVSQIVGLLIGSATSVYGQGIEVQKELSDKQVFGINALSEEILGNQGDLEWIYVLNVTEKTLKVYGGQWTGKIPSDHVAKGVVDPFLEVTKKMDEYKEETRQRLEKTIKDLNRLGFKINPA
jgi:hypothetical protein